METRYYYIRWSEVTKAYRPPGTPVEKERRPFWFLCTKARAEKRQLARGQVEAFESFVVSLTETETEIPDKGTVIICEMEGVWGEPGEKFVPPLTITLEKDQLFGGEDKEYRAQIALDIWHSAAACHLGWHMRQ